MKTFTTSIESNGNIPNLFAIETFTTCLQCNGNIHNLFSVEKWNGNIDNMKESNTERAVKRKCLY